MKNICAKILTVLAFCLLVFGCKKNDAKGKLTIELVSVNKTTFEPNANALFTFKINHPTSEVTQDTLFIRSRFITCSNSDVLSKIVVPEYTCTANYATTYELAFIYGNGLTYQATCNAGTRTDSLYYTFWLKDKNGNKSDSISSGKIILKK